MVDAGIPRLGRCGRVAWLQQQQHGTRFCTVSGNALLRAKRRRIRKPSACRAFTSQVWCATPSRDILLPYGGIAEKCRGRRWHPAASTHPSVFSLVVPLIRTHARVTSGAALSGPQTQWCSSSAKICRSLSRRPITNRSHTQWCIPSTEICRAGTEALLTEPGMMGFKSCRAICGEGGVL